MPRQGFDTVTLLTGLPGQTARRLLDQVLAHFSIRPDHDLDVMTADQTSSQVAALDTAQLTALDDAHLGAISAAAIAGLATSQLTALGTSQIAALTERQFVAMNADQLTALSTDQIGAVGSALRGSLGRKVSMTVNVDPRILGGLKVKVGSRLIDSSLATKLQRLQLAMKGQA